MKLRKFIACMCAVGIILCSLIYCLKYGGELNYINIDNAKAEIYLEQDATTFTGSGVSIEGNTINITSGGTYILTGTLIDGQINVDVGNNNIVELVLNGANITSKTSSAIYIANDKMAYIYVNENTENNLTSSTEDGGTITLKDDATICGTGTLNVCNSINNGIHCSNNLTIKDCSISINAKNKGIKGKDSLTLISGIIFIEDSFEGLEGNAMTIDGGYIYINASDDGINANDSDEGTFPNLTINGGCLYINANGDGIDSNGNITMNGGYVLVEGPTNDGNGILDCGSEYGGKLLINGGVFLGIGSNGMAEYPEDISEQPTFAYNTNYSVNSQISIYDSNNKKLIEYQTTKSGSLIIFSSPDIEIGESYTIYIDDTSTSISQTRNITTYGNSQNNKNGNNMSRFQNMSNQGFGGQGMGGPGMNSQGFGGPGMGNPGMGGPGMGGPGMENSQMQEGEQPPEMPDGMSTPTDFAQPHEMPTSTDFAQQPKTQEKNSTVNKYKKVNDISEVKQFFIDLFGNVENV